MDIRSTRSAGGNSCGVWELATNPRLGWRRGLDGRIVAFRQQNGAGCPVVRCQACGVTLWCCRERKDRRDRAVECAGSRRRMRWKMVQSESQGEAGIHPPNETLGRISRRSILDQSSSNLHSTSGSLSAMMRNCGKAVEPRSFEVKWPSRSNRCTPICGIASMICSTDFSIDG